jgi:hypothetical protein
MSLRRLATTAAVAAGALACAGATTIAASGSAGAVQLPNAIVPQAPFTAGTPFDSGQGVDVVVPPGTFTPGANVYIFECAAPNGALPATTASCDGNTAFDQGTISALGDGSVDLLNGSTPFGSPYTIYALPDTFHLEETSSSANCGLGAAHECVLYIGTGGGGDTGFALPHVFSQVFQVGKDATDSGTVNPGDGTPEVPLAVGLPLLAVGIIGGTALFKRRRNANAA